MRHLDVDLGVFDLKGIYVDQVDIYAIYFACFIFVNSVVVPLDISCNDLS